MAKKNEDVTEVVERDSKATVLEAGDAVEQPALSQMGATFAERAAARKQSEKRVSSKSSDVEDKAVAKKSASSKKKS